MADEKPDQEKQADPKGAVEIEEEKLDEAAGGSAGGDDLPTESISLNFGKAEIDYAGRKSGGDPNATFTEKT